MRPRLKPSLRRVIRDDHTLQYGAHPQRAVMLSGLTRKVRAWVESLDGTRDIDTVLREAALAGLDDVRARSLLDQLAARGVLHDAAAGPGGLRELPLGERDRLTPDLDALDLASTAPDGMVALFERRRRARVRVYGAGRVGAQVVTLLAASGVGVIRVIDPGATRPRDITPGGLTWAEVGMTREAGAAAVATRLTAGGSPEGDRQVPDVRPVGVPKPARAAGALGRSASERSRQAESDGTPTKAGAGASRESNAGRREEARTSRAGAGGLEDAPRAGTHGTRGTSRTGSGRSRKVAGPSRVTAVEPGANVLAGGPFLGDKTDRPDLVVIAPVGPLDGVLVNDLNSLGIPHLLVTAFEGYGTVGPLVLPGETACLHCLDLTRRDLDPDWPIVTARLGGYPPGEIACSSALSAVVAAAAVGHALGHLDGQKSVVTNGTLDVTPDWHWKRRSWSPHPQCRCMRNKPDSLRMVMAPHLD
ncbi:hypothetical protein [Nonomuraea maritima]|nr:hypothetical protein [Nonomuraea maritima]